MLADDPRQRGASPVVAAGFVSRVAAFVIDLVVLGVACGAVTWAVDAADAVLVPPVVTWERSLVGVLLALAGATGSLGYFVGCWTFGGRTVGLLLLGLRVVTRDGGPMTLGRALVRFAGYALSAAPLYVGFLWVLVDPHRRGWHDLERRGRLGFAERQRR